MGLQKNGPRMQVEIKLGNDDYDEPTELIISGEVDIYNVTTLRDLLGVVDASSNGVIVNLRKTRYFDSTGCYFLLDLHTRAQQLNKQVRVLVVDGTYVLKILKLVGLHNLLDIEYCRK